MAKRIIKIILILLAIFFILLGGMWLLGRHQAKKSGATVLSFKQFLGLGSSVNTAGNTQGTLSSLFTGGGSGLGNNTAGQAGSTGSTANNPSSSGTGNLSGNTTAVVGTDNLSTVDTSTQVSQFTADTFAPDTTTYNNNGTIGSGNLSGSGSGIGESQTTTTGGIATSGSGLGSTSSSNTTCSTADTTITFTPDEIQQLNALQTQFNQIAANLETSDDVAAETANYSTYKLEEAKIAELQNFCQANTPLLTDPAYQRHVPTPFWHDSAQDSDTYIAGTFTSSANGTDPRTGESFLERVLRINLW